MVKPYKKKPRPKPEDVAVIEVTKTRPKKMTVEKFRELRQSLKRPEHAGRPRKGTPKVTIINPPTGRRKTTQVKEVVSVNIDMTPDPPKEKKKPRGHAFEKGHQWRWKPGQSGNPHGINRKRSAGITIISKAYTAKLKDTVPPAVAEALGFDTENPPTWAEAMAAGMVARAVTHDTPAAKEIREVTEGKLPESVSIDGKIDYTAGENAKDRLLNKLMGVPPANEDDSDGGADSGS